MALFGKKNQDTPEDGGEDEGFVARPQKAQRWVSQARQIADTGNYTYALTCYASAIKLDPHDLNTHKLMFEAAVGHFSSGGKPASRKELKDVEGPYPTDKFAVAELAWMRDVNNYALAMKLLDASNKAELTEFSGWLAPKAFNMLKKSKKQTKSEYVKARNLFAASNAWDEAFEAGQIAAKLDPSDTNLVQELKQLTAQRAIIAGGYEKAASEKGSFRSAVKDIDEQQRLEDESSLTGGSADDRAVESARAQMAENPESPEAVNKFAKLLLRLNTEASRQEAVDVFMEAFERLGQYQFKMSAGDLRIADAEQRVRTAATRIESPPDDVPAADLAKELEESEEALILLKEAEYSERSEKYPTDRGIKFQLGNIQIDRGDFEGAMANFQDCKDEPKYRVHSAHRLGNCFAEEGWFKEASSEYKEALDSIDATNKELELPIKYDMMVALIQLAREQNSKELAEEAAEICSEIVRKNIKYRDIRDRRREIDELSKSMP
ncbi:MAG: hypothetical protein CBC35_00470 [Planctomycetes bacterium TMED75]|nr:hypothetical protein [Planctomycetaceae bacterium]OUU96866.1 MAG: hypothetical protein CBC35_00470 [Planctomycetes bacterium TMED75]